MYVWYKTQLQVDVHCVNSNFITNPKLEVGSYNALVFIFCVCKILSERQNYVSINWPDWVLLMLFQA